MLKRLVKVFLIVSSVPMASMLLGISAVGCGCTHCCKCAYSCSSAQGSQTWDTGENGECVDCDDVCAAAAKKHGCGESDVTTADSCD